MTIPRIVSVNKLIFSSPQVNAKLVNEPIRNTSIPYLASDVWFQDNEEKELKEPSRWDHKMYQDYGTHVIDELNELASEASQQCLNLRHQQLPAPVPAPHPGLFPPMVPGPSSSLSLSLPSETKLNNRTKYHYYYYCDLSYFRGGM